MSRHASVLLAMAVLSAEDRRTLARRFDIEGLRITVAGSVPVVEGTVPCYRMKKLAGAAVARLLGVLHVVNQLRVVPQPHRRDAQLVDAVRAALAAEPALLNEAVSIAACDGIVTLRGSVSAPALRCQAESLAWSVGGVKDVENRLHLRRVPAAAKRHPGVSAA